jgi:adenosylmethionine---8-amino-7-oxononanoate aminotransferase
MNRGLFVTGTDTDVGKTWVATLLCYGFSRQTTTNYLKPIQSGTPTDSGFIAERIAQDKNFKILPEIYRLDLPASPNRAAQAQGLSIEWQDLTQSLEQSLSSQAYTIVEGAGGLEVPINDDYTISDLIQFSGLPCLLVASTRLGTINHTLLSVERLRQKQIPCLGIVLNGPKDPGLAELLCERTGLPLLFEVPELPSTDADQLKQCYETGQDLKSFIRAELAKHDDSKVNPHQDFKKRDQQYVWHPFTQHAWQEHFPLVTRGEGSYIWADGEKLIDGVSSWWVNLLGHSHPEIAATLYEQAQTLEHVVFAGFTHEPAIQLSQKLVELSQSRQANLSKVFFSDNGSTAVEVALKMAYQFQAQRGQSQRQKFLALEGSYHGDTLGAMSVGARGGFHKAFEGLLFDVEYVNPFEPGALKNCFQTYGETLVATIFEPLVQGAGGMRMYPPEFLNELSQLCQDYGVLTIADEIFTGFYRTGTLFAFEQSQLRPDLLCLSKGITAGFLPLAVTLATEPIFESFLSEDMGQAFLHGHSYTANPLACKVAVKTLEILERPQTQQQIHQIIQQTSQCLSELRSVPNTYNHRQLGTIGALEINSSGSSYFNKEVAQNIRRLSRQNGVLLRPLGNTLYSVPPYCTSAQDIKKIYQVIEQLSKHPQIAKEITQ